MSESKRSWRRGWRLALLVTSPVWLFAVGEGAMRLVHTHDPSTFPAVMAPRPEPGETNADGLPIFQSESELRRPGVRGVFRGQVHRTDRHGFRGPDHPTRAEAGTRRVLLTGDSIAMGSGVAEADTMHAAAERWLNRQASPPRWEFINVALAGVNLKGASDRLERGMDAYGGDLLVYAFIPNDIEGRHYRRFPAERTALDLIREAGWPARSESALVRVLAWEWHGLWDRILELNTRHYAREVRFNYFENPAAWQTFEAGLDRLARLGAERGRCVVMLVLTRLVYLDPAAHPFSDFYDAAAAAARSRGIHVVETRDAFFGRDASELSHSQLDPHPNAAGHRLVGETLGAGIRDLPASCWSG